MHPIPNQTPFRSAELLTWLLNLATRLLARSLNMPEPLVHDTGMFVYVRVQEVETSIGRKLCPIRLWRLVQAWCNRRDKSKPCMIFPRVTSGDIRWQASKRHGGICRRGGRSLQTL